MYTTILNLITGRKINIQLQRIAHAYVFGVLIRFFLISFLFQDLDLSPLNSSILSRYTSELKMHALG